MIGVSIAMLLFLGHHEGLAIGLAVEPGGLLIQGINPGERYDLEAKSGLRLKIINKSGSLRHYRILVATPKRLGMARWTEGYSPIPEPAWVLVEPADVAVSAGATGYARIFINIPADVKYFNQHWVVALSIQAKPKKSESLSLALKPVYYLETQSRRNSGGRLYGTLGIVPTKLECSEVTSASGQAVYSCGQLEVHNGESRPHAYSINSEISKATAGGQKIWLTPGFTRLSNPGSIVMSPDRFALEPKESRSISVRFVPQSDKHVPIHNREGLLWVRSDQGNAGFVRLLFR